METIQHAAIRRSDRIVATGKQHCDIINSSPIGTCKSGSEQGFLTSTGRFVSRIEGMVIALNSKQVPQNLKRKRLYSEDLWSIGPYKYDIVVGYYK